MDKFNIRSNGQSDEESGAKMTRRQQIETFIDARIRSSELIQSYLGQSGQDELFIFYESEGVNPPPFYLKYHSLTIKDGELDLELTSDVSDCEFLFLIKDARNLKYKSKLKINLIAEELLTLFKSAYGEHYESMISQDNGFIRFYDDEKKVETFEISIGVSFLYK